jgi:Spy/CpxP family protein refolding chaperone
MKTLSRLLSLAIVAGSATLLCAADASAQVGRHPSRHVRREAIARKLGLTEAQREQMRASAREHRAAIEVTRDALRAAGRTLKTALAAEPRDPATIDAARSALKQAKAVAQAARDSRRAEVGAALTPEQREQIEAAKEARQACRRPWR